MAVVTILRELGSGGHDIASQAATELGYDFVDRQVIERIFRQYGLTKFEEVYSTIPSFLDLIDHDNLLIVSMLNEMVDAVAQRGNAVILGRSAFAVLGDCADVLHVLIRAPAPLRAQRMMEREGLGSLEEAQAHVAADDELRRKFLQMFYTNHWEDESQFGLVLDTGSLSPEEAVRRIAAATQALAAVQPAPDAATTARLQVDPVLADAVAEVLAHPMPSPES